MKLDRNIEGNEGRGKYALIKLRDVEGFRGDGPFAGCGAVGDALRVLENAGVIEWGAPRTKGEFFVIKLRDQYAQAALKAYADAVAADRNGDDDYCGEIRDLADRAGTSSPFCKRPD